MNENKTFNINIIQPIGFCNGVNNAILKAKEIKKCNNDKNVYILGELVHNIDVTNELKKDGIIVLDVQPNKFEETILTLEQNSILIFSAHGHDEKLNKLCKDNNIEYYDTTCPIVKNIENIAKNILKDKNSTIIYIGKENHPETQCILSLSEKVVFYDKTSRFLVDNKYKTMFVINQSTICGTKLESIYNQIKSFHKDLNFISTSCNFVNLRIKYAEKIIHNDSIYYLVLGSNKSSNTIELYNEVLNHTNNVKLISIINDLKDINYKQYNTINILSGTSVPKYFIDKVIDYLNKLQ